MDAESIYRFIPCSSVQHSVVYKTTSIPKPLCTRQEKIPKTMFSLTHKLRAVTRVLASAHTIRRLRQRICILRTRASRNRGNLFTSFLGSRAGVHIRSPRISIDAIAESLGIPVIAHVGVRFEGLARNDRHGLGQFLVLELVCVSVDNEECIYSIPVSQPDS